jgi:hypothetical protein
LLRARQDVAKYLKYRTGHKRTLEEMKGVISWQRPQRRKKPKRQRNHLSMPVKPVERLQRPVLISVHPSGLR